MPLVALSRVELEWERLEKRESGLHLALYTFVLFLL